jgi:aldehyde dehydrogenase (NAD+)
MNDLLSKLGIDKESSGVSTGTFLARPGGALIESVSPVDGQSIGSVRMASLEDYEQVVQKAVAAFDRWRRVPAPRRGEVVRRLGQRLRDHKRALGRLISYEVGKIASEGEGEVQEMIDIADFAVGLSRQLYGNTMHSERPMHRMYEQWHPLGVVGIISAFNFPAAVWSWNAMLAAVCGDTMIWKPSPKAPLTAVAVQRICDEVLMEEGHEGVMNLVVADVEPVGQAMLEDERLPLISATGSCAMGRVVGQVVARRMGRSLLELGGNNAIVVWKDADLDLAVRAAVFAAVGTAGQRCTSTRRLFVHDAVAAELTERLIRAYRGVKIGNPLEAGVLMGPLIDTGSVERMQAALRRAEQEGGEVLYGGRPLSGEDYPGGCYVEPAIVRARPDMPIVAEETFAPILYVLPASSLEQVIAEHNSVKQGLSSAIFTRDMQVAEQFLAHWGSDCGIANVNIGTSGAEIGGAFGGEKETGGGREAGSDSWKAYMRRQTCTINYGNDLPLAQGVTFV